MRSPELVNCAQAPVQSALNRNDAYAQRPMSISHHCLLGLKRAGHRGGPPPLAGHVLARVEWAGVTQDMGAASQAKETPRTQRRQG